MANGDQLDEVLAVLGYGRWHLPIIILSVAVHALIPVHQLGSTLLSSPMNFRCSHGTQYIVGPSIEDSQIGVDAIMPEYPSACLEPLPPTPAPRHLNVTKVNLKSSFTGLASCPEVEYDTSVFASTIVSEWHLVCERTSWRTLFPMMYPIGSMIGGVLSGILSDSIGRKRTAQLAVLLMLPTCIGVALVPWFTVMLVLKAISHLGVILLFYPSYNLAAETAPPAHRGKTLMLLGLGYFVFMVVFGVIGSYITSWRLLWLISNGFVLIAIPMTFMVDESPRWLAQRGRGEEAADILEKAATLHGVSLADVVSLEKLRLTSAIDSESGGTSGTSWVQNGREYFTSRGMRTILVVGSLLWVFQRTIYLGIVLSANNFTSDSTSQYIMTSGGMGCLAVVVVTPLMAKLGRRTIVCATLLTSTACLLAELAVPADMWIIRWALVMSAFCFAVAAFQVNYAFAAELLPTVFRTRGFTLFNLVGCLGEATVPFITEIIANHAWWAASVCFGGAGVAASGLVTLLPETKDQPLPETIADVERRHQDQTRTNGDKKKGNKI